MRYDLLCSSPALPGGGAISVGLAILTSHMIPSLSLTPRKWFAACSGAAGFLDPKEMAVAVGMGAAKAKEGLVELSKLWK